MSEEGSDFGGGLENHMGDAAEPDAKLNGMDPEISGALKKDNCLHNSSLNTGDTHDQLMQMVVELKFQNEYLKSQFQDLKNAHTDSIGSFQQAKAIDQDTLHEDLKELQKKVETLNRELSEANQARGAAEEALKHLQAEYSEAEAKSQKLSAKLAEAQHNMDQQLKERDEKFSELDCKSNRLPKRAKQHIQDVEKDISTMVDLPNEELQTTTDYPSMEDLTEDIDGNVVENLHHDSRDIQDKHNMAPNMQGDEIMDSDIDVNSESLPVISIGMEFKTHEEAWLLYLHYSSLKGFQPRKHTTYRSAATQVTIGRTYVCSKEGTKHIHSKGESVKRKRDTRENCKARMRITLDQKRATWRVSQFIDDHCHELGQPFTSGSHRSYMSHQNPLVRKLIACLHGNGVSSSTIAKVISSGALNNELIATNQQCHNQIRRIRGSNIGYEYVSVIQHFQDKVKNDPMFFFAFELGTEGTLRNVFWADGRSRGAYLEFNDVVSFDFTYRKDKFLMPFAPFTGVNHHRQPTLFGCALLADETEESFVWLFKQWLNCMFDVPPKTIITDQNEQVCSAIKRVFPNTHHVYCSWLVNKRATEHLGLLEPDNQDFAEDYFAWLRSESVVESESRWENLKTKYSLGDHNWLVTMYEKRMQWVPAYTRDVLTCGMQSTQKSTSIYSFFDGYVHSMTPLSEFVQQYDKALASRRKAEKDEDFATLNSKPSCESGLDWEVQAASFYTRKLYDLFCQEFIPSQSYLKEKVSKDGGITVYRVGKRNIDKRSWRIVVHDVSDGVSFTCSCAKFETEGILCRHVMAIMRLKQIPLIPGQYFLKRWSIHARLITSDDGTSCTSTNRSLGNEVIDRVMSFSLQIKHCRVLEAASSSVSILKEYETSLDAFLAKIMIKKSHTASQATLSQTPEEISPDHL